MKKKVTGVFSARENLLKFIRVMKLMGFFLFAGLMQVSANIYSQSANIKLSMENAELQSVIREIQKQTEFVFFYSPEDVNGIIVSKVEVEKESLEKTLEICLAGTMLNYEIIHKAVVLKKVEPEVKKASEEKPAKEIILQPRLKEISGSVKDEKGLPLPGVSVMVKGTTTGTITDNDGNFGLLIPVDAATLVFSFVGMKAREIPIGDRAVFMLVMEEETIGLEDVVVTALGITREKKGLGYAVQEIKGDELNEARETNFVNSLAGKVAGVNISSSGAVGSSSRIIIRGESSLNFGANEPLYIVDGVPVGNVGTSNSTSADYGNSSAEINPSDIESMTVLKGPAASALYGSRAANGVIVITTKSGKGSKGLGVTVNSGTTFEEILRLPKFQNEFGQGRNGLYRGSNFGAGWSIYPNGLYDSFDESWGPRLNVGTLERQFHSPTLGRMRGGDVANPTRGEVIPTPWVAYPDNIRDFFETGKTYYNNVSLTGSNDKGNFRLSYTNLDQTGVIPNNDLQRNTFAIKSDYKFTEKFRANVSANYINSTSTNRPETGYGRHSLMYFMVWSVRNMDINAMRNYWQTGFEGKRQFQYNYGENHNNPFFYQYENTKGQDKHRLFGTIELYYDLSSKLSVMARGGTDVYNDFQPMKWAISTVGSEQGRYMEVNHYFKEQNVDFLFSFKDRIGEDFNYRIALGGNQMNRATRFRSVVAPELLVPNIYTITNSATEVITSSRSAQVRINSAYAFTQLDYRNTYFVDITARNDWSSTLPINNNSFFYPSVSFSVLTDQLLSMPDWVAQAKIRLGAAQVGNDTEAYNLYNTLIFQQPWGNNYTLANSSSLKNNNLKPESITTYEIGTDIKLLNNRLNLDFTFYDTRAENQIINVPLTSSTSYSSRVINAGEIQNTGFEIMLSAVPIQNDNGLRWTTGINFSKNTGKVLELASGITSITQSAPGENASIQARIGEKMGEIYGPGYQRVESGPLAGEIIIFENGRPKPTVEDIYLGNINPDWIGSFSNSLVYKNFNLAVLVDVHYGGEFVSRFYNKGMGAGQLLESAEGRSARAVGQEYDGKYYMVGAAMINGSYVPNSTSTDGTYSEGVFGTDARDFHKGLLDHISEGQLFDATYMKLRELKFGYKFPNRLFGNVIKDFQLSLVGRNLFLWTPKSNQHFDPEVSTATTGSGLVPGFENMSLPSTRSYGINLNVKF
jgi:TonB-linked SusC/RagA family outer membrane protein